MTAPTPEQTPNPFPYPGARGLVTTGKVARPVESSSELGGLLAQAVANAADAITVELFGNQQQRNEVHAWMRRNGERR